ncbi:DUF202 domain-containing protein [uncultured Salinisphaera sp.]|uniref:YidH family protein n=1 Tax=uncultured Salinisphaera sp. TaxID=359372 RepID=UPI0032B18C56|tara:strand:+ start:3228 stop:3596 length:369 start_codon:yes stop_codon:yes gene_type:complete
MTKRSVASPVSECEPDYRFTLANERTFLAWIRTALALLAGAVAITQLVPDLGVPLARQIIASSLAVISIAVVAGSALRWRTTQQAMRRSQPLPGTRMPWALSMGIIAIGGLVIALVLIYGVN